MIFPEFAYKTAVQRDSVIVVAGGPSVSSNMDKLVEYAKQNNSIIYSANYNFTELSIDYTYIGDAGRFVKLINTITSPYLLVSNWLYRSTRLRLPNSSVKNAKRIWKKCLRKHKVFSIGRGKKIANLKLKKWKSLPSGELDFVPSPSGFAALVLASMSRPKRILIAGLDGPQLNKNGKLIKERFDGHKKSYRSGSHFRSRQRILKVLTLPFLLSHGIKLETFSDCLLWGVNKKKFNIRCV